MQHHSPIPYTPFPDPLHVRGNLGALTCAFKGQSYLLGIIETELQWYKDIGLDWIVFWPYDEGGCGCHDDWPWGARPALTCGGKLGLITERFAKVAKASRASARRSQPWRVPSIQA